MRSLRSKEQADQAARIGAFVITGNSGKTLLAAVAVFYPLCFPAQWLPTIRTVVGHAVADATEKRQNPSDFPGGFETELKVVPTVIGACVIVEVQAQRCVGLKVRASP